MKILIIRNFPSYMSVKNNTYNIQEVGLAKALVRKGNKCDIVFWTDKEEEIVTIPVDNCGEIKVFYRKGKTNLKNTVYTNCDELFSQYDILQPCEYNQIQSWLLSRQYPEKVVIYHGPYYSTFNKRYNIMCKVFDMFFLKSYIKQHTKFIVKSEMAKAFLEKKGVRQENVAVVGVGIDVQMLSNKENVCEEILYTQMKNDLSKLKILYIGRFEERRNIHFILDVFNKVYQKESDAKLYLIGTGNADYLKSVFEYASQLGINDKIVWQEKMEQKYLSEVYKIADFFLLPTEYEIFGMVLLEAMYYRNVVLTTKNGGSSTLIKHGQNGFIIENKDIDSWAECILNVYMDMDKKHEIQMLASNTIENEFTWDVLADEFLEQYNSRLSGEMK